VVIVGILQGSLEKRARGAPALSRAAPASGA
jgi:hypothetical protein